MNENDDALPEEVIEDALASFRAANVPAEVEQTNRAAIRRALLRRSWRPWWQRTVAVPVPLVIAAMVTILAMTVWLLHPAPGRESANRNLLPPKPDLVMAPEASEIDRDIDNSVPEAWSISRSYIRTIQSSPSGRVTSEFDKKENRNDS